MAYSKAKLKINGDRASPCSGEHNTFEYITDIKITEKMQRFPGSNKIHLAYIFKRSRILSHTQK
jgi:hypothetical protein